MFPTDANTDSITKKESIPYCHFCVDFEHFSCNYFFNSINCISHILEKFIVFGFKIFTFFISTLSN